MVDVYPIEVTVPTDHPKLHELVQLTGADSHPILIPLADRRLPFGNCYWNAATLIEEAGGEILLGWMLLVWPGVAMQAQHHAVWRSPGGELLDITDKCPGNPIGNNTLFLIDEHIEIDPERVPNIKSYYLPLTKDRRAIEFIAAYEEKHRIVQRMVDFAYASGYRCAADKTRKAKYLDEIGCPFSDEQKMKYEALMAEENAIMRRLGDIITSLWISPPNSIARAALPKTN